MSKRTIEAYRSVFHFIHKYLIPLFGEAIIIDFEKAMRKAMISVLTDIDSVMFILGCWFHYCQAIRRKVSQMSGLFTKIRNDDEYKDIFRRFQCLPLLPLEHIEEAFLDLAKEALKLDSLFAPFVDYFHKEWMQTVTPKYFCVYNRGTRTTGDAESYNGKCNQLFKAHPGFYQFCETLQKMEASSSNELMNFVAGVSQKGSTNTFYKKRAKLIKKYSIEYKDNPKFLLKVLANPKNKIMLAESNFKIVQEDIASTATDEMFGNEADAINREVISSDESDEDEIENVRASTSRNRNKKTPVNNKNKGMRPCKNDEIVLCESEEELELIYTGVSGIV